MKTPLTYTHTSILCYDDGNDGNDGAPPAAPAAAAAAAVAAAVVKPPATPPATPPAKPPAGDQTFSQTDVNKFLAEDRRKHTERYAALEGEYKVLLDNQNLTTEARDSLQGRLDDLQASQRTTEQQVEYERKQAEEKFQNVVKTEKERADHWEDKYKTNEIQRSLQDAAVAADAFNPSHIVALLQPGTELKEGENGELVPMVKFADIDEKTGEPTETLRTPAEAVKRMRELPQIHGCLFKSNVVSGVGSGSGEAAGASSDIDYTKMTPEYYREHRAAIKSKVSQQR